MVTTGVLVIKKNEIMLFAGKLEIVMLCKISQTEKDKCLYVYLYLLSIYQSSIYLYLSLHIYSYAESRLKKKQAKRHEYARGLFAWRTSQRGSLDKGLIEDKMFMVSCIHVQKYYSEND
jgi:hypothetical protein